MNYEFDGNKLVRDWKVSCDCETDGKTTRYICNDLDISY